MFALQFAGVIGGLGLMVLAPPADGLQLLVPLNGAGRARMLPLAIERSAQLVGEGPLPGSFVVRGARAALFRPLLAAGVLTLAAPAGACGLKGAPDADR